jgi:MFS family permease
MGKKMTEIVTDKIPRGVWVLGLVSLLMDVSSEMIHSLLPVFMVASLGASGFIIGLIEGIAEATALIVKVFSGALSDYFQRRKGLALLGYGLGAVTKPLFPLASGIGLVVTARFIDRIGKGIRGAPRDAMVADLTPPKLRGAAFGLRQALDSVGAFLGPLLAVCLMLLWANDVRAVFWVASIPAFLAVALLFLFLKEPKLTGTAKRENPISRAKLSQLPTAYWGVVGLGAVFSLARFSEAFLLLRAQDGGMPLAFIPLVLVAMNLVYALTAYPFGKLSDRMTAKGLLMAGLAVLVAADVVLARGNAWPTVIGGVMLWGVHLGLTQGLLGKLIADTAPADLRGTAFGLYNLVSGISLLFASVVAGLLWDWFGPATTFWMGAGFAMITLMILTLSKRTTS